MLSGVRDHLQQGQSVDTVSTSPVTNTTSKPIVIGTGLIALAILAGSILIYMKPGEEVTDSNSPPGLEQRAPPLQQGQKTLASPAKVRSNWIAVLPFATLSGTAEMDLLARGITTQMIHALGPIDSFSIVPYRTVENFKDRTMDLEEMAQRCLWYFKNSMSEEKAQRFVEGLVRAQVES